MEAGLDLLGGSGGSNTHESLSTVSKADSASSEVSSTELDLGLGLSLGTGVKPKTIIASSSSWGEYGRILTAKDFPSIGTSSSSSSTSGIAPSTPKSAVSGTKRAADSITQEGGSANSTHAAVSQVVGWPPIRTYRINSLVNQNKNQSTEDGKMVVEKSENNKSDERQNISGNVQKKCQLGSSLFVKVTMDGVAIGRKVDLNAHVCYETLAQTLEDMFYSPTTTTRTSNFISSIDEKEHGPDAKKTSKLLGGSSEFVLTYEDKDGDWMLVGDVPWGMFLRTVKRLRIMRTSEANGLAPRFQDSNDRQRNRPI